MTNKSKNSDTNQEFKVPPAFKFQEGEKVLCFHGPLIYEAKCLQSRYDDEDKNNKYHIHYSGWNKSWDEWVPESRVLKHNEGNIQRQKELHKAQKAEPKGKKGKKRSVTGKEKETDGKEKDPDDSRSSTPVNEKGGGGGKASASATQSSSQESASDIPKRKRSKLDPSVETPEESPSDKKDPPKPSLWKVSLAKSPKKRPSETSPSRPSSGKNASVDKKTSPDKTSPGKNAADKKSSAKKNNAKAKELSPKKPASPKNNTVARSTSPQKKVTSTKSPSPVKQPSTKKKSVSPKKPLSPSKLYPVLKGRKLSVKINKLDIDWIDEKTGSITPPIVDGEIDDLTMFGAYVVDQLRRMSDKSKVTAMKIKIRKYLTKQNAKANK